MTVLIIKLLDANVIKSWFVNIKKIVLVYLQVFKYEKVKDYVW